MPVFWVLTTIALGLGVASLRGDARRNRFVAERLKQPAPADPPPATVIVPVKGPEEGLAENLASLARLDYPDYELIVVARAREDIPAGVVPPSARVVLAGDGDPATGEKINNLLAAVREARPVSRLFAFADSDGRAAPGWLKALAAGLEEQGAGASTGYRWHVPERARFWPLVRAVWNGVVAGELGPSARFAWGGAMAIRRDTFYAARVPEFWRGSVSDDYSLTAAVHAAGLRVAYAPGAYVASVDGTGGREFLRWIVRQMAITRTQDPQLWAKAFAGHLLYCGAYVAALAALLQGRLAGLAALGVIFGLGMIKGANRLALGRMALPHHAAWFDRHGWVHVWWVPLATWVWMYSLAVSAFTKTIEWRGRRYRLYAPGAGKAQT
ncbi:MAG: glycosyltransferase [Bryobacteraceae bacterium]|nr:glycosyltransferase [Bryobacteraceae bacterium]